MYKAVKTQNINTAYSNPRFCKSLGTDLIMMALSREGFHCQDAIDSQVPCFADVYSLSLQECYSPLAPSMELGTRHL